MTLVVVDFAMTSGLGFVSAANQANELRAYYMARSGISVGLAMLALDERNKTQTPASSTAGTPAETLNDAWAIALPSMGLEGGNVSVSIVDEARKLDLNQMVVNGVPNLRAIERVQRLFTILKVDTALIPGIVRWITPAKAIAGGGGADYYLGLRPPYQPRFGPMPTIADLRLVRGINEAVFNRLRPFLTVTPENKVNINTASPQVNRVARTGIDRGSEDRRGDSHGAAGSAIFQCNRPRQRHSLGRHVWNPSYPGLNHEE